MAREHVLSYALNAGGVDPKALTRVDLAKMRLAGEHPVANLVPEVLGPLALRPGTESLARMADDAMTRQERFLRTDEPGYMLLLTPGELRIGFEGAVQQVPAVATEIVPGAWSDESADGASATGGSVLTLTATALAAAVLRQAVSVTAPDRDVANVLRLEVEAGPVYLRLGTSPGATDLLPGDAEAELDTGVHKTAFVPEAATVWIDIRAVEPVTRTVSLIQFEAALLGGGGDLVLPTPWATWAQVQALRTWQSVDVVFAGDGRVQQRRIEHRGPLSWGVALYKNPNGPFIAGDGRVALAPTDLRGNITVTASGAAFKPGHAGALLELTSTGKTVSETLAGVDQATDYITVVGVGQTGRRFQHIGVSNSFQGTLVLERSFEPGEPSVWSTFATFVDGAATSTAFVSDEQDNLTVHYRFRVTAYTSGSVAVTLVFDAGAKRGVGRITQVVSAIQAAVEVLDTLGSQSPTRRWRIGDWSDHRGWPRLPIIHDGRMHWFRADQDAATVPDDYVNYDDGTVGDSAPFRRSVGAGGADRVLWAVSDARLVVGTAGAENIIQSSDLDGPLTRTDYTVRPPSRRGSADIPAVPHDDGMFFVHRSRRKLYELSMVKNGTRYASQNISRLNPAAFRPGIRRIAVQQQPDTRCYAVLDDGTLAVLTWERDDEVAAITTMAFPGGHVEDIQVLPADDQDDIYLIMRRGTQRYWERLAKEAAQESVETCALLDAHKVLAGPVSAIAGALHLAGKTVQVWADGRRRSDVVLDAAGNGVLDGTYDRVVYGLRYMGRFKTVKLAHAAGLGTAVGQTKIVRAAGLLLHNACLDGIRIGPDELHLDPMADFVAGAARAPNQLFAHVDQDLLPINSDWNPDARVYVEIDSAEGPVTLQGIVMDIETRDGAEPAAA